MRHSGNETQHHERLRPDIHDMKAALIALVWKIARPFLLRAAKSLRDKWAVELAAEDAKKETPK